MQKLLTLLAVCAIPLCGTVRAQEATSPLQMPSAIPAPAPAPARATTAAPAAPPPGGTATGQASTPGLLNGYVQDDTYKLRVGDKVSFQILEDQIWDPQNAPKFLDVQDSGEIEVPYVGRMM